MASYFLSDSERGVFRAASPTTVVLVATIEELKKAAAERTDGKARLCLHSKDEDPFHQMVIVHAQHSYVRPHRHTRKSEALQVIEGDAALIVFDDAGEVRQVHDLGKGAPLCRIAPGCWHTLLINSPWFVFHETALGPFDRSANDFAPWSPEVGDSDGAHAYRTKLAAAVRRWQQDHGE